MLGDTFTLTLSGDGGTAKVLPKINQDNFGATYLLIESTQEFEVRVSHKRNARDRHFIEAKQTVYATSDMPELVTQASMVIQNPKGLALSTVSDLAEGLSYWASSTNILKLLNLES